MSNPAPTASAINAKRTYLSLLPPFQLVDLLLAIDADRSNTSLPIFPPNLDDAIKQLQAARQAYPGLYAHPYYVQPPPVPMKPGTASVAPNPKRTPANVPEVKEEVRKVDQSLHKSPNALQNNQASTSDQQRPQYGAGSITRNIVTSEPRVHEDMPSYEEMIAEAIAEMNDPEGTAPKVLFAWMAARYPLQSNFRPSASQALQKAFRRGRMLKSAQGKYRLNPAWEGGATSRRTSRRPQKTQLNFTPPQPHPRFWPQNKSHAKNVVNVKTEDKDDELSHQEHGSFSEDRPITSRVALRTALGVLAGRLKDLIAYNGTATR